MCIKSKRRLFQTVSAFFLSLLTVRIKGDNDETEAKWRGDFERERSEDIPEVERSYGSKSPIGEED